MSYDTPRRIVDTLRTSYFECQGTARRGGDAVETAEVSVRFGEAGVYIGQVKANLGHTGCALGPVCVIKAVLALEKRTVLLSIEFSQAILLSRLRL